MYIVEGLLLDRQKTQTDMVESFLHNYMSNKILHVHPTQAASSFAQDLQYQLIVVVRTRDHEDHHDDNARPKGESSAKRQKMSEHGTYSVGESSSD
uniref:Uncharacterized protein n=1 Tax=Tanacetum cinerariifolium TaxID=118510 RepID=A0A699HAU8_TANCI|nr:hypothetical protein [Tanacetum cinerariifolium]